MTDAPSPSPVLIPDGHGSIDAWPDDADPRWRAAVAAFEAHHAADPRPLVRDGVTTTVSLDYHARVSAWVRRLDGVAGLPARLGALAQHVRRFELPRTDFPATPQGYKRWRANAGLRQAELARTELERAGFDAAIVTHTCDVMLKKRLAHDPLAALLEDAVCVRFVQDELASFAAGRAPDAVLTIISKTWAKMSPSGHQAAVGLLGELPPPLVALVAAATAG